MISIEETLKISIDEILMSFHLLMKRKHQHKRLGSCEAKAYREEAKRLKEHLKYIVFFQDSGSYRRRY